MVENEAGTSRSAAGLDEHGNADYSRSGDHRPRYGQWLIGAAALALVGFGLWHILHPAKQERRQQAQVVATAKATTGDMPVILEELGTVTPTATVTVLPNANVSGYLTKVYYQEGEMVAKGQLLAEIDSRPYQVLRQQAVAALAKDQALLEQAKYDFSLYRQLNEKQAIAQQTANDQKYLVQQYAAAVQQDKANIAQYDLDIQYCHITAPVAGRAGLRLVDPGNYVTGSSSTGIVVLTTVNPILVQFGVAQNDIGKVAARFSGAGVKLPVTVFDSSTHQQLAAGELYAIGNQMNTSTGQTLMRASFDNSSGKLFPNAFVNVRILVDTLHNVVRVPTPAVLTGAPGTYVYYVNNPDKPDQMTVSVRKVTIGPSDGEYTVVTSGLQAGDRVVTDGTDRLSDGAAIRYPSATGSGSGGGRGSGSGAGGHRRQAQGGSGAGA